MRTYKKIRRAGLLVVAGALLAPVAVQQTGHALGPNLLPNPSFERSVVEPPPPVPPYSNPQPLLPEGWIFEGAAGLFDHSQNGFHSGRRMAAISIALSGKRRTCGEPPADSVCVDDPTAADREHAYAQYYSTPPAWRNALPVPVQGSTSYTVSAWMQLSFVTVNEGATLRVRWLDANGVPIRISSPASARFLSNGSPGDTSWTSRSATITSPAAARQAVVLLAHTTDVWIGQIRFDDVFFGRTN